MVELRVSSGKTAGASVVARRFPLRIGRSPSCDLRLEENGVWDQHLQIFIDRSEGLVLEPAEHAFVAINGHRVKRTVLRVGDIIEIGSAKVRFWLSEPRQTGLTWREGLTWVTIAALSLGQIGLIYWLLGQ